MTAPKTESYESYLAPRVAAVQSERRPNQAAAIAAAAAAVADRNSSAASPSNSVGGGSSTGPVGQALYNLYDSPTMLPRTPIAPGEF
jgi:hypothetical protein